jgi:serine/threonine protein phosphatase PrpC
LATSGSGTDTPEERSAGGRRNVIRPLTPTPPAGESGQDAGPPMASAGAAERPRRVIRPLAPATPGPSEASMTPASITGSPAPPVGERRRNVIQRLDPAVPGGRDRRVTSGVIRRLIPLPPTMPGLRDLKTGIIRPLLPLPPLPGTRPEEVQERRQQRDARLTAILRPLTPLPLVPTDPNLRTAPLPALAEEPVLDWVICERCESTNRATLMFCLQCGAVLPAAAELYDTLAGEYETMQSAERPKAELIPRLVSGRRGPNWQAWGLTDKGRVRKNNEDTLLATPLPANGWLLVVADGMGGAEAGEVASQQAAEIVRELIENRMSLDADPDTDHRPWLIQAVEQANAMLYHEAEENPRLHGMGTTLTAGIVQGLCLELGHAGDSRCYRLPADGPLEQLTTDHAIVSHLLRLGQITPEEARTHPLRNQLYRAVATAPTIEVDAMLHILAPTDKLLFCSDGLILHLSDDDIEDILRHTSTPQQACRLLVDLTLQRGAGDNVSAVVLMAG